MVFNSFEFLVFLPVVFLLYWILSRTRMQQNLLIVTASYLFYGWWDWRFLFLIAFTSLCSYACGITIAKYEGHRRIQKFLSTANIILNLLILCIFKYYNFFAESFAGLFRGLGYQMDVVTLKVILPVGISFYTFQALSYTIDVYQGRIKPSKDIIQFFAYICFFPQLVAGPIERATNLLPQFNKSREFDYSKVVDGLRQMLWGFFKKIVVADSCAAVVNAYWSYYDGIPGLMYIMIAFLFTFQIYCDFSGYSDIAIGCAKLFGIRLMSNFNVPYFSRNIAEFWRRWHISLMLWFRDYVYIPMGGNRCIKWHAIANVLIVFVISGLWHGANWTFIVWGGYNGVLIVLANMVGLNAKYDLTIAKGKLLPSLKETICMTTTFILVLIGWILFRSESIGQAFAIMQAIINHPFYNNSFAVPRIALSSVLIVLVIEWLQREKEHALCIDQIPFLNKRLIRWPVYYAIIAMILWFNGSSQIFIYFQF